MANASGPTDDASYVDTPAGIGTARGRWYHATEAMLDQYAGEVLEVMPLDTLLKRADAWLDAPRTLVLWTLPALLLVASPVVAAGAALVLYLALRLIAPSLPLPRAARVVGWMQSALLQGAAYVAALSVLANGGNFAAVATGLAGFVLLRWQLVDRAAEPVLQPLLNRLYPLPVTDQVLRGLIVRIALRHRLSLSHLDDMASDIMENWGKRSDDRPSDSENSGP